MRISSIPARAPRSSSWPLAARSALIIAGVAAAVLAGAACGGKPKPAATPAATPTAAPQAAGAAKQAAQAMKTDLKPLGVTVPLPLPKLDGLTVSMNPLLPALKEFRVNSDVRDVPIAVGAIAVPPYTVNIVAGPPSIESLMPAFATPSRPATPGTIPTMPPGVAPGATPPAGFPTPPAGLPGLPPGFTLPPGVTIPGFP